MLKDPKIAKKIKAGEKVNLDKVTNEKILNRKFLKEEGKDDKDKKVKETGEAKTTDGRDEIEE
jgi:hypothetical protein